MLRAYGAIGAAGTDVGGLELIAFELVEGFLPGEVELRRFRLDLGAFPEETGPGFNT